MYGEIPKSELLYSATPRAKASDMYKAYKEEFDNIKNVVCHVKIQMIKIILPMTYNHLHISEYWYAFPLSHSLLLFLFKDDL